jgi:hypothetical protein
MGSRTPLHNHPVRFRPSTLLSIATMALIAALTAGCGGSGGMGSTFNGNTTVVVLASSTANDQLSSFTVFIQSLTLTSKSGATVNLLATPVSEEFIHLNGHVEPIATLSIPQGDYVSASATFELSAPVCHGQATGEDMTDWLTGGPSGTINLAQPITVTGEAMGLVLDLQVSEYPEACPTQTEFVTAPPVTATFNLAPLTIAAQPTNSANGSAVGLQGTIASVNSAGAGITVNGLVDGQTPPLWQADLNGSTVFQGVSGASQLTAGLPVNMDLTIQPDGSFLATRVEVISTDITALTLASGTLINVYSSPPVGFFTDDSQEGYLPWTGVGSGLGFVNFGNAQFQISGQFENLASLPFTASFNAANMVVGQNLTITTQATADEGGPAYYPATTMTLATQTIDGTVSAISSEGNFTTYTVTLAPYDLFPQFAVQPGQTTLLTNPSTVVVYADSSTQMLNSMAVSAGRPFRFYGLVFNDNGTLRMDCAQVNDGVTE